MKPFLEGKTVLVAGGARDCGRAVARALHHRGARVILVDRGPRDLIRAAKEIGEIICVPAKLPAEAGRVLRRFGRVDALVTAAGKRTAAAVERAYRRRAGGAVVRAGTKGGKAAAARVVRILRRTM